MNGILYFLVGGASACAIVLAFLQDVGRISSTDVAATVLFVAALGAAAHFQIYSRWGRRSRLEDEDDRVRTNARTKGEVRIPPLS